MSAKPTVIMAGGGTGGHVYPGLALARELERQGDVQIRWVGTEDRVEAWAVPNAGYPIEFLDVQFLKGRRGLARLAALLRLPKAFWDAFRILRRHKPKAVVGLGGFVSGPLCLVAGLMRTKVYLLEQNAHAGLTNRVNGKVATKIFATFPESKQYFPPHKVEVLGNPIRRELLEAFEARAETTGGEQGEAPLRILVVGGSQGSLTLNTKLPKQFQALAQEGHTVEVRHASGRGRRDEVLPHYEEATFDVTVTEYIDDMAEAYAWADLLVCRAGATTISELTSVGLPALYIPFPFAADDHQTANARSVVEAGGGWMVADDRVGEREGLDTLRDILRDRGALERVAEHARALGRADAGEAIAAQIWKEMT